MYSTKYPVDTTGRLSIVSLPKTYAPKKTTIRNIPNLVKSISFLPMYNLKGDCYLKVFRF